MASKTELLDSIGIDAICQSIESGKSQAEIAAEIGVSTALLSLWLNADDERIKRSARAREESAESWLDKGLGVLSSALDKSSGIDATAARAYEQACARRAALRNPLYREKSGLEMSGPNGGPINVKSAQVFSDEQLAAIIASK